MGASISPNSSATVVGIPGNEDSTTDDDDLISLISLNLSLMLAHRTLGLGPALRQAALNPRNGAHTTAPDETSRRLKFTCVCSG